jgi:hypothetical protein
MQRGFSIMALAGLILLTRAATSSAFELKTQYATVVYDNQELLRKFNGELSLGSLSYLLRNRKNITFEDEARNKIEVLVERVEAVLDMFPRGLAIRIVLLPRDTDVQKAYRTKYGVNVDYIAFYSPREKTMYVSVDDVRLGVLAHELTHAILDRYFGVPPPTKIHEVLAQFVETHLRD